MLTGLHASCFNEKEDFNTCLLHWAVSWYYTPIFYIVVVPLFVILILVACLRCRRKKSGAYTIIFAFSLWTGGFLILAVACAIILGILVILLCICEYLGCLKKAPPPPPPPSFFEEVVIFAAGAAIVAASAGAGGS